MNFAKHLFDEHFLVLEMGPDMMSGFLLSLDHEKRITPLHSIPPTPWGKQILYAKLPVRKPTPIVALDSSLAYTALIPVHFIRERIREPLRQIELENFLSQAVGKNINQIRKEAAEEIGADEVDVLLVKSRVVDFKIDDHEVLNPLGFRAQKIEGLVELTLTTREVFEEVKRITGTSQVFFTEIAHAELSMLEKVEDEPIRMLRLRPWHSSFFTRESAPVGYAVKRGALDWTIACFENAIAEAWAVSRTGAREIYKTELRGGHGDNASRFLAKLIKICSQMFTKELEATGLKGKVFLDTSLPLPFALPMKKRSQTIVEPPLTALLDRFGFTLDPRMAELAPSMVFRYLAPFFENFYDRGQGGLNQWLRKHLHWLGSPEER